jgi:hypothetical protein
MTKAQFRNRLKKVSVTLTVGYLCVLLSGVAFAIATPSTIRESSAPWQRYAWAGLLIIGGAFSASDLFTGRRGGELFGSWPIAGALFLCGGALIYQARQTPGLADARTGFGWLLIGFGLFVVARFFMLKTETDAAKAAQIKTG